VCFWGQAELNGFPFQFMEKIYNESDFDSDDDYDCSSESDRDIVLTNWPRSVYFWRKF